MVPETAVTAFANANIEKRRKSMNGKRVRMAVMSAVILSALAVSGCSSEGSVSYNGSGEKADDVSASLSAPVASDTTSSSESKETQEQTSYESKPAVTSTNKAETTAVTTKKDNAVKSEWKETKADGTKYVTVGCYSREKAVLGAKTVKLYNVNDKVTVVAVTDTGYAKLKDGTFIHNDFLSDSKVTVTAAPTSQSSKKPTEQKPAQSQTSEYSWVIKPSYVYDEVEILKDMLKKPAMNMRLWDDYAEEHDSGKVLPVAYIITQNNNYGLILQNGDVLMNCEYEYISTFSRFVEAIKANSGYSYTVGSDYKVHKMENFGHGGGGASYYIYDESNGSIGFVDPVDSNAFDKESAKEAFADRTLLLKSGKVNAETKSIYEDGADKAKFGLMFRNKIIIPLKYDGGSVGNLIEFNRNSMEMCDVKDGRVVFWKNNKIYVFDKNGKCYFNGKYDKVDNENQELYYFNGYLPVCKGGKWGLIDVNGKEVLKCRFEDITSVYDGKAWAKENGKWGVIKLA